jgi:RNA polymerase sigma factor (sigma-70 family)
MTRKWTDRELYDAFGQNGSDQQHQAFELLYRELYTISLFMLQTTVAPEPQALAQDCAQEAIVKAWKNLATCEQPDSLRSWAKTIARNQTLNAIARLKRQAEEPIEGHVDKPLGEENASPIEILVEKEKYATILDLLAAAPLSERSRYVIAAKFLAQMTEEEICVALSEKEQTELKPSHVQVTRAKNFKKIYSNAELLKKFKDLQDDSSP